MAKRGRPKKKKNSSQNEIVNFDPQLTLKAFGISFLIMSLLMLVIYFVSTDQENIFYQIINKQFGLSTLIFSPFLFVLGLIFLSINKLKFVNYKTFISLFFLLISFWMLTGEISGELGILVQSFSFKYLTMPGTILLSIIGIFTSFIFATNLNGIKLLEETMLHLENTLISIHNLFKSKAFNKNSYIESTMKDARASSDDKQSFLLKNLFNRNKNSKEKLEEPNSGLNQDVIADSSDENSNSFELSNNFDSSRVEQEKVNNEEEKHNVEKSSKDDFKQYNFLQPPTAPIDELEDMFDYKKEPSRSARIIKKDKTKEVDNDAEISGTDENINVDKNTTQYPEKVWERPDIDIFDNSPNKPPNAGNIQQRAMAIEDTLEAFGIKAKIADVKKGPAVTLYAIDIAIGTSVKKITSLSKDLATRLESPSGDVRMVTPIPGTNLVGIEVPNFSPSSISIRSVIASDDYKNKKGRLLVPVGQNVDGTVLVEDIAKWPHALIAGATGSGKSIFLNSLIASLLYRYSPQELRLLMIDPKFVELTQYNGIPHLLAPVVTDMENKAVSTFAWTVSEMDRRYRLFEKSGVRSLEAYNAKAGFVAEPIIVIVVDELADMMMVAAKEVETYITRLAQKSRATGIHLILATQRPTTNILTGTIKANVPTRIAFRVTSGTDSRVILDQVGAETLIGKGDMLYSPPNDSKLMRIQGVFTQDQEIKDLVQYLKDNNSKPDYNEDIFNQSVSGSAGNSSVSDIGKIGTDAKFNEALEVIVTDQKASASYLQRRLGIGYARAARLIDEMEAAGIVGEPKGSKPRDILVNTIDEGYDKVSGKA